MLDAIMKRRSIRKYSDEPVPREDVDKLIDAASAAPSACNARPVRFVLLDKKRLAEYAEGVEQKTPFEQAQWGIAVCADTRGYAFGSAWLEDCAASAENVLIAASSMGLGALWYGVYARAAKEPWTKEFLKLPRGVEVASIITIGRPAEEKRARAGAPDGIVFEDFWKE